MFSLKIFNTFKIFSSFFSVFQAPPSSLSSSLQTILPSFAIHPNLNIFPLHVVSHLSTFPNIFFHLAIEIPRNHVFYHFHIYPHISSHRPKEKPPPHPSYFPSSYPRKISRRSRCTFLYRECGYCKTRLYTPIHPPIETPPIHFFFHLNNSLHI